MDDLDAAIALVYAQPPSGFVAARGALVKELKTAKRKDDAARVAALRRPTKLAWAVAEAVREAPEEAASFFAAVEALAELAGPGGSEQPAGALRQLTADLREAVASLVEGVDGIGHGEVTAAFMAIAADPEATEALRLGRLADIPAGGGFGGLATGFAQSSATTAPPKAEPKGEVEPAGEGEPDDEARTAAAAADAEAAARREEEARERAERIAALEAQRDEAVEALAAAAVEVDAARAALAAAQAELASAAAMHEERRASLAALEQRLQEEATTTP